MHARGYLTTIAIALAMGGAALAQTDIEQLQPGTPPAGALGTDQIAPADEGGAPGADQVAPGNVGDRTRVDSITPESQADVQVEQPEGRDLCDPAVPESVRRRAGVNCESELSVNGGPEARPLTETPGLGSGDEDLGRTLQDLDLGEDVPPSVILQQ